MDTIVLSGGSTSALLTLGRLFSLIQNEQVILENIKLYCGTSAGAIICLLMCCGMKPDQIAAEIATSKAFDKLFKLNLKRIISGNGIFQQEVIENEVRRMIAMSPVGLLHSKPLCKHLLSRFVCCTYNFSQQAVCYHDSHVLQEEDPVNLAMASCAIPFLFQPKNLGNDCHVDGGLIDNFPLEKAVDLGATNICAILIEKRFSQKNLLQKDSWGNSDILDLMFAASNNGTQVQIKNVINMPFVNLYLHKLSSSIPFFDMHLDSKSAMRMFADGMLKEDGIIGNECNIL